MGAWPFLRVHGRPPLSMRVPGRYWSEILPLPEASTAPSQGFTFASMPTPSSGSIVGPEGTAYANRVRDVLRRGGVTFDGPDLPKKPRASEEATWTVVGRGRRSSPERHSRADTSSHRGPSSSPEAKTVAARRGPARDVPPRPTKPFSTALKSSRSSGSLTTKTPAVF